MMEYLIPFAARGREREREEERETRGSGTPSREEELGKPQAIIYLSHLYGRARQIRRGKSFQGFRSGEWCGGNPFSLRRSNCLDPLRDRLLTRRCSRTQLHSLSLTNRGETGLYVARIRLHIEG